MSKIQSDTQFITLVAKEIEKLNLHISNLKEVIEMQQKDITKLIHKSGALESVQLVLFSALAETNPGTHARISEEISQFLAERPSDETHNAAFLSYLKELSGVKAKIKPYLRLVPSPPRV